MNQSRATGPNAQTRAATYYSTFYMGSGAAVMFLPIWLDGKGITPEQIGIINSVPIFVILLFNLVVGRLADRASDWRQVIVIGSLIGGIVPIGLFFVNEFWGILLFCQVEPSPLYLMLPPCAWPSGQASISALSGPLAPWATFSSTP
jgi:PPP family 3-phenylpropionic acid transporter